MPPEFNSGCNLLNMLRTAQLVASGPLLTRLWMRPLLRAQASRLLRMYSQSTETKSVSRNRQDQPNKQSRQRGRFSVHEALMQLRAMSTYDGYGSEEYMSIINCMMDVLEETDKTNADKVQSVFKELPHGMLESNFSKMAERIPTFGRPAVTRVDKDVSYQEDRPKVQDLTLLWQTAAQEGSSSPFLQS